MSVHTRRISTVLCTVILCQAGDCEAAAGRAAADAPQETPSPKSQLQSASKRPQKSSPRKSRRKKWTPVATAEDPYGDEAEVKVYDPFEKFNKGVFAFNSVLYKYVTKPLARFTEFVIPAPVLTAANRVIDNAESPVRITSSLFQGKGQRAAQETGKLLVNSTVGIGGIWKPSERIEALSKVPYEDTGQALGFWGIPSGPYLVVPVLGPSSVRDLTGKAGDSLLSPTTWIGTSEIRNYTRAGKVVVENPDRMKAYDAATEDALDKYIALREAYTTYRNAAIDR
jgi:phospholipid-binding lipoprotein MlaA